MRCPWESNNALHVVHWVHSFSFIISLLEVVMVRKGHFTGPGNVFGSVTSLEAKITPEAQFERELCTIMDILTLSLFFLPLLLSIYFSFILYTTLFLTFHFSFFLCFFSFSFFPLIFQFLISLSSWPYLPSISVSPLHYCSKISHILSLFPLYFSLSMNFFSFRLSMLFSPVFSL